MKLHNKKFRLLKNLIIYLVLAVGLVYIVQENIPKDVIVIIKENDIPYTVYGKIVRNKVIVEDFNMDRFIVDMHNTHSSGSDSSDRTFYKTSGIFDEGAGGGMISEIYREPASIKQKVIIQNLDDNGINKLGLKIMHRIPAEIQVYLLNGQKIYYNQYVTEKDIEYRDEVIRYTTPEVYGTNCINIKKSFIVHLYGDAKNDCIELDNPEEIHEDYIDEASNMYTYHILLNKQLDEE